MYEVLVNRLGGLSLPRKSVVRLTDRPDMTSDVYRGRKTTTTTQQHMPYDMETHTLFVSLLLLTILIPYFFGYKTGFFLPKQSKSSRSVF